MSYQVLLYPQTLFYPLRLLKADPLVEKYFVLKLIQTEERIKALFPDKISKLQFLTLKTPFDLPLLSQILSEITTLGNYLRTPESLKIYKLHQDLFEETYPLFRKRESPLNSCERAFLLLALAEEIDFVLLEVSLSLNNFSKTWEKIFEEKILFKDLNFYEETFSFPSIEEIEKERLWETEKRKRAFKVLFPQVDFISSKPDTLLISEEEILEDWKDEVEILEEKRINEDLWIFELKDSLNEKLGLFKETSFPNFKRIIMVK